MIWCNCFVRCNNVRRSIVRLNNIFSTAFQHIIYFHCHITRSEFVDGAMQELIIRKIFRFYANTLIRMICPAYCTLRVKKNNYCEALWSENAEHVAESVRVICSSRVGLVRRKGAVGLRGNVHCLILLPTNGIDAVPAWLKLQIVNSPWLNITIVISISFTLSRYNFRLKQLVQSCCRTNRRRLIIGTAKVITKSIFGLIRVKSVHGHAQLSIILATTTWTDNIIVAEEEVVITINWSKDVRLATREKLFQCGKLICEGSVRSFLLSWERVIFVHK